MGVCLRAPKAVHRRPTRWETALRQSRHVGVRGGGGLSLVKAYKQCSMLLRKMMPQHRLLSSSCSSLAGHVPIVAFEDIPGSGFRRGDDFVDPAFSVASSRPRWTSKSQMNNELKFSARI